MERLTIPDEKIDERTTRRTFVDAAAVREHAMEFYWRLKDYENTGLTPEQCENAKAIIESAFSGDTSKAERIRELLKADKEGRVAVLPCKVGDTVWIAGSVIGVYSVKVRTFFVGHPSAVRGTDGDGGIQMIRTTICDVPMKDFGKTVFLTREEAERALQEMEGKV